MATASVLQSADLGTLSIAPASPPSTAPSGSPSTPITEIASTAAITTSPSLSLASSSSPSSSAAAPNLLPPDLLVPSTVSKNTRFKAFTLPNGLTVALTHDPECVQAAGSLTVRVGSLSDSPEFPGLAHAIEHTVTTSSQKFPNSAEYRSFVSRHGGYCNAMTLVNSTHYFFRVSPAASPSSCPAIPSSSASSPSPPSAISPLFGALDRFASIFTSPLFSPHLIRSEINAINEEHLKNVRDDVWRLNQLERSVADPAHPFNHFSTGTNETLGSGQGEADRVDALRQELLRFFSAHYTAGNMSLAVTGRESLDVLEDWVSSLFSGLKPGSRSAETPKLGPPYGKNQLGSLTYVRPVAPLNEVRLIFPYPDQTALSASKPHRYIIHLLTDRGPGSVFQYLKSRNYVQSVSAEYERLCPGSAVIRISVKVNVAGITNYREIVLALFQYIEIVKQSPPKDWIMKEIIDMETLDFTFSEPGSALQSARTISDNMNMGVPLRQILAPTEYVSEFDPAGIRDGLTALRPDNFLLFLVGNFQSVPIDRIDPHYGTEYGVGKVDSGLLNLLKLRPRANIFHLPAPNPLIPTSFAQPSFDEKGHDPESEANFPSLLLDSGNVRVWHQPTGRFKVPKAAINLCVRTPSAKSPFVAAMLELFAHIINDSLSETVQQASRAGLHQVIQFSHNGIQLLFDGYSQNLARFVLDCIRKIAAVSFTDEKFKLAKIRLSNEKQQIGSAAPYTQLSFYTKALINRNAHSWDTIRRALDAISADRLRSFSQRVFRVSFVEMLFHGDISSDRASSVSSDIAAVLPISTNSHSPSPSALTAFSSGRVYLFDKSHSENPNSCVTYLILASSTYDLNLKARTLLFHRLCQQTIYSYLRYEHGLGYMLGTFPLVTGDTVGMMVAVQSSMPVETIGNHIAACLNSLPEKVLSTSGDSDSQKLELENQFVTTKRLLIEELLQKPSSLREETALHWRQILCGRYDFEEHSKLSTVIQDLSQEEMLLFYHQYIQPKAQTLSSLLILQFQSSTCQPLPKAALAGPKGEKSELLADEDFVAIPTDIEAFKASLGSVSSTSGH